MGQGWRPQFRGNLNWLTTIVVAAAAAKLMNNSAEFSSSNTFFFQTWLTGLGAGPKLHLEQQTTIGVFLQSTTYALFEDDYLSLEEKATQIKWVSSLKNQHTTIPRGKFSLCNPWRERTANRCLLTWIWDPVGTWVFLCVLLSFWTSLEEGRPFPLWAPHTCCSDWMPFMFWG